MACFERRTDRFYMLYGLWIPKSRWAVEFSSRRTCWMTWWLQEISVNPWHSYDPPATSHGTPSDTTGGSWKSTATRRVQRSWSSWDELNCWRHGCGDWGLGIGRCWGCLNLWRFHGYLGNLSQPEWRLEITDAKERLDSIYSWRLSSAHPHWTRYGSTLNPLYIIYIYIIYIYNIYIYIIYIYVSQCPWYNARLLVFKSLKTQKQMTCQVRLQQKVRFGFGARLRLGKRVFWTGPNKHDDHVTEIPRSS